MGAWKRVEVERDGTVYAGKYRVEGGIITVTYDLDGGHDRSAKVGSSEPDRLAKSMLSDIVMNPRSTARDTPL